MVKIAKPIDKWVDLAPEYLFARLLGVEQAAWDSEFYKRLPKKITATSLLLGFWEMIQNGENSLSSWACKTGEIAGPVIDKQSLNERLNEQSCDMLKILLCKALTIKMKEEGVLKDKKEVAKLTAVFNRILLRDSTTQKLPDELRDIFKGGYSSTGSSSVVRIQALFDFVNKEWKQFDIGSYTDNDQSAADCIYDELEDNDLILQDLGYFSLDWLEKLTAKAYVITKWKSGTYIYTTEDKKIDILSLMKGKETVDMNVLVGAKKKLPMRMVARRLPSKQYVKRLQEAKNDRHSKSNHSKEYFECLRYEVYLTNVDEKVLTACEVAKTYGLRWHIEILFKSWKSFTSFKQLFGKEKMQKYRVIFSIYAFLIKFVWLNNIIYQRMRAIKKKINFKGQTSVLKFMDLANSKSSEIFKFTHISQLDRLIPHFIKHSAYDKRSDRENTVLKYLYVNELCSMKN